MSSQNSCSLSTGTRKVIYFLVTLFSNSVFPYSVIFSTMKQSVLTNLRSVPPHQWDFKIAINMLKSELDCNNDQCYSKLDSILKTKFEEEHTSVWLKKWKELIKKYEKSTVASESRPESMAEQNITTQFNIKNVKTINNNNSNIITNKKRKLRDAV